MSRSKNMQSIDVECSSCDGTGLYSGMAERDGLAVVCHRCDGSGKQTLKFIPFTGRRTATGVRRVIEVNPGMMLSPDIIGNAGLPYEEWDRGPGFPPGSEVREFCCPAEWYQSADYARKPRWDECAGPGRTFARCEHYDKRGACWKRFDRESK